MTDDRLEGALADAIADLAGTGSPDYLDDILERTSHTRQRPWWTFPGRYLTMTPTFRFATATAVAFALGLGTATLILPFDSGTAPAPAGAARPGTTVESPPAASTGEAEMSDPPAHFTGRVEGCWPPENEGTKEPRTYEADDLRWVIYEARGFEIEAQVESSDERFSGRLSSAAAYDEYWLPDWPMDLDQPYAWSESWRLANDDGTWTASWDTFWSGGEVADEELQDTVTVFEGSGAYEGYEAIVHVDFGWQTSGEQFCFIDLEGWIVEGGLPRPSGA